MLRLVVRGSHGTAPPTFTPGLQHIAGRFKTILRTRAGPKGIKKLGLILTRLDLHLATSSISEQPQLDRNDRGVRAVVDAQLVQR